MSEELEVAESRHGSNPNEEKKRDQWGGQIEFLLACLGNAVGLGNVSAPMRAPVQIRSFSPCDNMCRHLVLAISLLVLQEWRRRFSLPVHRLLSGHRISIVPYRAFAWPV